MDEQTNQNLIPREANGILIHQSIKQGYWNATEMCQAWGKQFHDWSRTESAQEYLKALELKKGIPLIKLVIALAGRYGGTWIHPLVANRLAQWLNPAFAVTVDEWIEELKHGRYPQAQASDPHVLSILDRHEIRLTALEGRKRGPRNREHDRLIRKAISRMGGKCPCGCGRQMLKEGGLFVDGVHVEHWNELSDDNRLANKWALFQKCHTEKHKNEDKFYVAFMAFQRVMKMVEEEDTAIIAPSPFAQRIIDKINSERFGPRNGVG